jgi:hypothetical protein
MGRYSKIFKEKYAREASTFPPPFNEHIKPNKPYKLKLLTEPRDVQGRYGRKITIVEVEHEGKDYTLYLSQVDMFNRMVLAEKEEVKRTGNEDLSLVGRIVILKQLSPRRYNITLEPQHQF